MLCFELKLLLKSCKNKTHDGVLTERMREERERERRERGERERKRERERE